MKQSFSRLAILSCFGLILLGCSDNPSRDAYQGLGAEEIFNKGEINLRTGNYVKAAEDFEGLEAHYPFGEYADKGQLGAIYAYFKANEAGSALAASERFIRFHPTHPNVDYAFYMRGLANYYEAFPFPLRYLPIDAAKRDPHGAQASFSEFAELLRRYPNSAYAYDARQKMIYLRNLLARNEIYAANFYMRRGAYLAAANRANYVVEHFQGTPEVNEALVIMVKSYRQLDLQELAEDALSVLKSNASNHLALKSM